MRRVNGYYSLENMKKIDKKSTGFFSVGWYTDGTDEYLFKREEELNAYRELFYSRVLKQLGLLVAEYDLAILDNQKGIISKNYNIEHNPSFTIEEIFDEICFKKTINRLRYEKEKYNLENLPSAIKEFCREKKWFYNSEIEKDIFLQFIIQILLGNGDLQSRNLEVQYNIKNQELKLSPFYDLAFFGNVPIFSDLGRWSNKYCFLERIYERYDDNRPFIIIKNFLQTSSETQIEILKEYLEKLEQMNYQKIVKNIEEQTEKKIEDNMKKEMVRSLTRNLQDISLIVRK